MVPPMPPIFSVAESPEPESMTLTVFLVPIVLDTNNGISEHKVSSGAPNLALKFPQNVVSATATCYRMNLPITRLGGHCGITSGLPVVRPQTFSTSGTSRIEPTSATVSEAQPFSEDLSMTQSTPNEAIDADLMTRAACGPISHFPYRTQSVYRVR